ncbi:type II toxin-antitoxin system prevent-host-death family antitoxin [Sphingomonas psychrotolerans]|uniref:Antitoxin n=1 Tax=Sphingomonas psychrotolerans TaxID=1327635 RepID=A0ABU3N352_9SPHN|nr:type II toxin-antitoxin system prevent-host-death family antitoxin [Sphingomonas psychrotolerans]
MERINLADAKARLCEIVDRVEAGESIEITRRGKPAAQLVPPRKQRELKPLTLRLCASCVRPYLNSRSPPPSLSAGCVTRAIELPIQVVARRRPASAPHHQTGRIW